MDLNTEIIYVIGNHDEEMNMYRDKEYLKGKITILGSYKEDNSSSKRYQARYVTVAVNPKMVFLMIKIAATILTAISWILQDVQKILMEMG